MYLTGSQIGALSEAVNALERFTTVAITGDAGAGKDLVAQELFARSQAVVVPFDLCELASTAASGTVLSNQYVVEYLQRLQRRLRRKRGKSKRLGVVYIRRYHHVLETLGDCYSRLRFFLPLILRQFTDRLPPWARVVITGRGCLLPEDMYWRVVLTTTPQDMEQVLLPYLERGAITMEQMMAILRMSKVVTPGRMTYSLRYALPFPFSTEPEDKEMILPRYREALARFSGALLDIEKTVPCPVPDADLVGLEPLLEEIRTAIILPLELAVPGIPIKKGALLCGPPGTGKSSIGRWLAHQIKGRFYLIGGTLSGSQLVDNFEQTVMRAQTQAPAVIFIDDCDLLFEHDEVFRSFLTILDGIETGKRADLCVILTCMDLRRIPAALLRGGRLEMVLVTRLPDRDQITAILEQALTKMIAAVQQQFPSLGEVLEQERRVVSSVALRMSGWNCADVHRAVTDVGRALLAGKRPPLLPLFEKVIREIKQQYQLCGATASTNLDHRPQEAYIS